MHRAPRIESVNSRSDWQQLFEAALLEPDPLVVAERFRTAKDAIMDRIEDSFDSASLSERRMLLSALNTIGELERLSRPDDLRQSLLFKTVGHAA
jgi:hypothetical protein